MLLTWRGKEAFCYISEKTESVQIFPCLVQLVVVIGQPCCGRRLWCCLCPCDQEEGEEGREDGQEDVGGGGRCRGRPGVQDRVRVPITWTLQGLDVL